MTKSTRWFENIDIYLTSFLFLLGHKPELETIHGKVIFKFSVTDNLNEKFLTSIQKQRSMR